MVFNDAERPDLYPLSKNCRGSDERQGVDLHFGHLEKVE
jgi:hypothetical protein